MRFDEMGLREEILRAIQDLGYTQPTPIQEQAIPQVLEGKDVMCCAQTGTGKTATFALPILQRLAEKPRANLRALVLVPTRELAIQVAKSISEYGAHLDLVSTVAYGGVPIEPQQMMLRHGVDILVATPGRLIDHMWRGNIDYRNTEYLVLDEADRMLDMGFIKEVREIIREIPTERQSMLFSATLDSEIQSLAKGILKNPVRIEAAPPATTLEEVDQYLVRSDRARKRSTLETLIRSQRMSRTIIFVRTKVGASNLARHLKDRGFRASAMHGDRTQSERVLTLEGFREGRIHFLVATDIAARGLDVDDVSHVVNYDLPYAAGDYVHRIGRTARAGRRGMAISLVTPEDTQSVDAIERLIARKLSWLDGRGPDPATEPAPARPRVEGHRSQPGGNGRGDAGRVGVRTRRSVSPATVEGPPPDRARRAEQPLERTPRRSAAAEPGPRTREAEPRRRRTAPAQVARRDQQPARREPQSTARESRSAMGEPQPARREPQPVRRGPQAAPVEKKAVRKVGILQTVFGRVMTGLSPASKR
jgi:ATP-dependent RNA helicase RhlE